MHHPTRIETKSVAQRVSHLANRIHPQDGARHLPIHPHCAAAGANHLKCHHSPASRNTRPQCWGSHADKPVARYVVIEKAAQRDPQLDS